MRRRLEKWSQGWVTPSSRQQPRQRTNSTPSRSERSGDGTGSFEFLGSEPSTSAAPSPLAFEAGRNLFKTEPPEACRFQTHSKAVDQAQPPVMVLELPQVVCHQYSSNPQDTRCQPALCTLCLTNEALSLERTTSDAGASSVLCSLRLDRVTDVALPSSSRRRSQDANDVSASQATGRLPMPISLCSQGSLEAACDVTSAVIWDLPPIPFAQLPTSEPGLRKRWCLPPKVPAGRWLQVQPLAEFDSSNAQPQQLLCMSIPPLQPSSARLPSSLASAEPGLPGPSAADAWVCRTVESASADGKGFCLVVWTASSTEVARSSGRACRLRGEGTPTVLRFAEEAAALKVREEMLRCRAEKLGL